MSLFTPQLNHSELNLSLDWQAGEFREMAGDPTRVRQILLNLISNAVKFTARGRITVRILRPGDFFRVEVSDTGIGIPLEHQSSIFQKFVQADHSTTRRYGGTGLGLAISRQLVEAMGGSISFESAPEVGSTFWFELPVGYLSGAGHAASLPEPELPLPSGISLLLAEDNPVNEKLARRLLENLGCLVDVARNGLEAVSKVAACNYDLVLMDCQMPKLDGFEATVAILRIKPETRVIALTANAMKGDRERCLAAGMVNYLTKPIALASLRQTLARNVRARSPQGPPLSLHPAS